MPAKMAPARMAAMPVDRMRPELVIFISKFLGWVGIDVDDGDERQAQIANSLEESVQRRLVGRDTAQQRRAVGLVTEAGHVQASRPASVEVPTETYLVGPVLVGRWCWLLAH